MKHPISGMAAMAPLIAIGALGSMAMRVEQDVPAIPAPLELVAPGTICTDGGAGGTSTSGSRRERNRVSGYRQNRCRV
jgi:hypothetical protein